MVSATEAKEGTSADDKHVLYPTLQKLLLLCSFLATHPNTGGYLSHAGALQHFLSRYALPA